MNSKELLLKQTAEAFRGRPDMPLMASLTDITPEEASWQPDASVPSIEHLLRHIGWTKSHDCHEGFGAPMVIADESINNEGDAPDLPHEYPCGAGWGRIEAPGIGGAIDLVEGAQKVLMKCLESCTDESLQRSIPTRHGKTAAHFFWIMLMHDLYHAGQIRTRRTLYRKRS